MAPITIDVDGTSTINHRAERAIMRLSVSSTDRFQEIVSTRVQETSSALKTLLQSLSPRDPSNNGALSSAAVTHWSNNSLSTSSHEQYDDKGKSLGRRYTARTSFEIKFRDFERLGSVATQMSTLSYVEIVGIEWRLTDETQRGLSSRSRRAAIIDAVRKAEDYFAAIRPEGKIEPTAISEGHNSVSSRNMYAEPRYMQSNRRMMRSVAMGEQEDGLSFEPEDVEIVSSVHVTFMSI